MHFHEFSKINLARCEDPAGFGHQLHSWSLSDWMVAVLGELGEAANIVKKLNRVRDGIVGNKETTDELRKKLVRELADADIYLDLLYQAAGIDREQAILNTFHAKSEELRLRRGNDQD